MSKKRDYMILHVDLFVRSMDTALNFYCNKLGFSVFEDSLLNGPIIRRVSEGHYEALRLVLIRSSTVGAMIELQEFQPESALTETAPAWPLRKGWISILVPDLRTHIENMRRYGVHADSGIFVVKLSKSRACEAVFYKDPDGNDLEFLQIQS
jgi:catechol 2,3-dioxygenase-like lactoylglutathione lyase family enzyme